MRRLIFGLGLLGALATSGANAASDPAFGRWVVENGKAVIEIAPCGQNACGQLVWLQNPLTANGETKRDLENPDPGKRFRPLCRLQLLTGLRQTGPGMWEDGEIYSTRDGRTFGFQIERVEGETLVARGFLGIALLGKTQRWTRDDGMHQNCVVKDSPGSDR